MAADPASFFSSDYFAARERFRHAAIAADATLDSLEIGGHGPHGEALSIDIARLGASRAQRVLLHTSGLHGIEAFAGSAVQLAALAAGIAVPSDGAMVLVHVLNPYGMAWLRRANENNVDLNRNFLAQGERWEGAPPLYPRLDPFLNPSSPPRADGFLFRLALLALRHGVTAPRQAIAEGQYDFPRGLFYGGNALETGPRLYLDWLRQNLPDAAYLFAIDLHTGLGRRGAETVILEPGVNVTARAALARDLGRQIRDPAAGQAAYRIRGSMAHALASALPGTCVDFVLQEIGTSSQIRVLHALREENRCHHHGGGGRDAAPKLALLEALCPASPEWRRRAVDHGLSLLRAAAHWAFEKRPRSRAE